VTNATNIKPSSNDKDVTNATNAKTSSEVSSSSTTNIKSSSEVSSSDTTNVATNVKAGAKASTKASAKASTNLSSNNTTNVRASTDLDSSNTANIKSSSEVASSPIAGAIKPYNDSYIEGRSDTNIRSTTSRFRFSDQEDDSNTSTRRLTGIDLLGDLKEGSGFANLPKGFSDSNSSNSVKGKP